MESIAITPTELDFFELKLSDLVSGNPSFTAFNYATLLKTKIAESKRTGNLNFPALRSEIPAMIKSFHPLSKEKAKDIANGAKTLCKGCMFHNESCLINFLFIVFKSVELGKEVAFKDMKPNVRVVF